MPRFIEALQQVPEQVRAKIDAFNTYGEKQVRAKLLHDAYAGALSRKGIIVGSEFVLAVVNGEGETFEYIRAVRPPVLTRKMAALLLRRFLLNPQTRSFTKPKDYEECNLFFYQILSEISKPQ